MIIKKKYNNKNKNFCLISKKKLILISFIILVALFFGLYRILDKPDETIGRVNESNKTDWKIYENLEYGFRMEFPSDWTLYESFKDENLSVSFYKDQFIRDFPLDYFTNKTHFSVYPNGIAQSGVIGTQSESDEIKPKISEPTNNINNFILEENNLPWVTFVNFSDVPENWKPWGFVLMRNKIKGYEEKCFDGNQEISIYKCNPFEGNSIKRFGTIDQADLEIQLKILETFEFIN